MNTQIVDPIGLCLSFPPKLEREVFRESFITTIDKLFSSANIVVIEGDEGIGKTVLLSQFARAHANHSISLFINPINRLSVNPARFRIDLAGQMYWILRNKELPSEDVTEADFSKLLLQLQRRAKSQNELYYFVVDGIHELVKQDEMVRDIIFQEILHLGVPEFRFLLSGSTDDIPKSIRDAIRPKGLPLSPFITAETKDYLGDLELTDAQTEAIHRMCSKGVPAHLASIRREILGGADIDRLLSLDLDGMPDFLDLEWRHLEGIQTEEEKLLAAVAFGSGDLSIKEIAAVVGASESDVKRFYASTRIIDVAADRAAYLSEAHRKYAQARLSGWKNEITDLFIKYLTSISVGGESVSTLTGYYQQAGRFQEIIELLTPEVFSGLLEESGSLHPVRRQTKLGIEAARTLNHFEAMVGYSLQGAALGDINRAEIWHSEVKARVALRDYDAALTLAQSAVLQEDRLQLLAAVSRIRLEQGLTVEPGVIEQIRTLVDQVPLETLGGRSIDIAIDLIKLDPDLAIRIVEARGEADGDPNALDWAFARLSTAALGSSPDDDQNEGAAEKVRSRIESPEVRDFLAAVTLLIEDYSAQEVVKKAKSLEVKNGLFLLRRWAAANRHQPDAALVIECALDLLVNSSTKYTPKMRDLRELATPLPSVGNSQDVELLVQRFDALKNPIRALGATADYVRLELSLAETEMTFSREAAIERLQALVIETICELDDVSVRLHSLGYAISALRRFERHEDVVALDDITRERLAEDVECLLEGTADHYELMRGVLQSLARQEPDMALELTTRLNTVRRRDRAKQDFIRTHLNQPLEKQRLDLLAQAWEELDSPERRGPTLVRIFDALQEKASDVAADQMSSALKLINAIRGLPQAIDRTQCNARALVFLRKQLHGDYSSFERNLLEDLSTNWEAIDVGWFKLDVGFEVAQVLAEELPDVAKDFLQRSERFRTAITISSYEPGLMALSMLKLLVRAFAGLLPLHAQQDEDIKALEQLVDLVPSRCERVGIWSELVQRSHIAGSTDFGRHITIKYLQPLLSSMSPLDMHARHVALIAAAPALFVHHADTAEEMLGELPFFDREEAYGRICHFLLLKSTPNDPYRDLGHVARELDYTTASDACRALEQVEGEGPLSRFIPILAKSLEGKFSGSREQKASILDRLDRIIAEKLPDARNIQHDGYKILLDAHLLLAKDSKGPDWDEVITRTDGIPNHSDRAYVLAQIASIIPNRYAGKRSQVIEQASTAADKIPSAADKAERYITLASLIRPVDRAAAMKYLETGVRFTRDEASGPEIYSLQHRAIDVAHAIDQDFATSLVSIFDDDPARQATRRGLNDYLEVLNAKNNMINPAGADRLSVTPEQYAQASWLSLGSLNANRITTLHIDHLREYVEASSPLTLSEAYPIFAWAIENSVRRHSKNPDRKEHLVEMFRAVLRGTHVALHLAGVSFNGTRTPLALDDAFDAPTMSTVFDPGERDAAIAWLRQWLEEHASEYLIICDPYFGPSDLELLKIVNAVNPHLRVQVLTSRKHLNNLARAGKISSGPEDAFLQEWERLSDQDPPPTRITIAGTRSNHDLPIHDRWWLTKGGGLRLGTSFQSFGIGKVSEISELQVERAAHLEQVTVAPLLNEHDEYQGERMRYTIVTL